MPIQNMDSAQLKDWMEEGSALLVDVREKWEYEAAAIPGAVLVPLGTLSSDTLPASEGKKMVLYCRSGMRSLKAADMIQSFNPSLQIYNLAGGILEWAASGNVIEQH